MRTHGHRRHNPFNTTTTISPLFMHLTSSHKTHTKTDKIRAFTNPYKLVLTSSSAWRATPLLPKADSDQANHIYISNHGSSFFFTQRSAQLTCAFKEACPSAVRMRATSLLACWHTLHLLPSPVPARRRSSMRGPLTDWLAGRIVSCVLCCAVLCCAVHNFVACRRGRAPPPQRGGPPMQQQGAAPPVGVTCSCLFITAGMIFLSLHLAPPPRPSCSSCGLLRLLRSIGITDNGVLFFVAFLFCFVFPFTCACCRCSSLQQAAA